MLSKLSHSRGVVLRKIEGRFAALFNFGGSPESAAGFSLAEVFPPAGVMLMGLLIAVLAVGLIAASYALVGADVTAGVLIAPAGVATTRDLRVILGEMKTLQDANKGKAWPQADADKFEALAAEAEPLQKDADRAAKLAGLEESERKGRAVVSRTVPDDSPEDAPKAGRVVAGFMSLGDYIASMGAIEKYVDGGRKAAATLDLRGAGMGLLMDRKRGDRGMFVGLSASEIKSMRELASAIPGIESKAVPVIGEGVIEPTRVPELVRVTEHDRLRLRDVVNVSRTTSDSVKYERLVSFTRAAAPTAAGSPKPEAAMELDTVTEAVRTIPVWIPVNNQQIEDHPQLSNIINNELLYDLDKTVEEQIAYGSGIGENFSGILTDGAVGACRSEGGDTLIDIIRRGITDVRVAGYEPNAVTIDPRDWETIVLLKGSDLRYVHAVVSTETEQRLWSVSIVETVAMFNPVTDDRNLIVGDWRRGATLWDRMDATISIGLVNDQFIRNRKTILAELRAAFGVLRPNAFRKHQTIDNGS